MTLNEAFANQVSTAPLASNMQVADPSRSLETVELTAQEQERPSPPNPLIYLDIWIFGGLVLGVMVFVGLKYLWKALQPDYRDPEEGLQPWEDPDFKYENPDDRDG